MQGGALASGLPARALDPVVLEQEIRDASGGNSPVDELCDDWLKAARERGITVDDEHGGILPDILGTISRAITAAFWSVSPPGIHHHPPHVHCPRQFLPYFEAVAAGSRGGRGGQ